MEKKYIFAFGIVIILGVICGIIVCLHKSTHQTSSTTSSNAIRMHLPKEVTVILTKNGFSPKEVTIKTGSAVRWVNKSGKPETVNSDNYPTNQLHRELNFGEFANGSSVVYTFKKPGVYGYHNQFHHKQEGEIIVVSK